jgi:hypothetical protein
MVTPGGRIRGAGLLFPHGSGPRCDARPGAEGRGHGRGSALLLTGEAGIGKTTVLAEAAPSRRGPRGPGRMGLGVARRRGARLLA